MVKVCYKIIFIVSSVIKFRNFCLLFPNPCLFASVPAVDLQASQGFRAAQQSRFPYPVHFPLLSALPFKTPTSLSLFSAPSPLSRSFSVFLGYPRSFPMDFPAFLLTFFHFLLIKFKLFSHSHVIYHLNGT